MSHKNPFTVVGKTTEGQLVISGILRFEETYGLPLEDILEHLKERNIVPSWLHIMNEAKLQGVNQEKFLTKLEACAVSVFGKDYWAVISPFLK